MDHAGLPLRIVLEQLDLLGEMVPVLRQLGQSAHRRIERAGSELADLAGQRPAAAGADPYALVTPFDQLLRSRGA
jgi:hypothetical protein